MVAFDLEYVEDKIGRPIGDGDSLNISNEEYSTGYSASSWLLKDEAGNTMGEKIVIKPDDDGVPTETYMRIGFDKGTNNNANWDMSSNGNAGSNGNARENYLFLELNN